MNFLLHRKIAICMLFIALTGLGYVSYKQLPVELLPNAELPMLFVQVTSTQDMDPSYVESEVVIPLEGAIGTIGGVEQIESQIDSRQSSIKIDFKPNINFKITTLKLQEKMNETASSLPEGFTVQVQKEDVSMLTGGFMSLQVRGSGGTDRVRNLVEKEIRPDLENIDGIASVNIYGGREKAIEVQLDPDACKALDLTPSGISSLLTQNTEEKAFVGYANEPDGKYFVHVNSPYTEVSDLENIVVAPGPVLLKDIATVFFDMKEETSYSRVNGKDAVSVSLLADSQANLIQLSHRTVEVIDRLNEQLAPLDLSIVVENNQAKTMEDNIDQIIHLAIVGGLLAVVILWLFLKNLRLVFFIALSIPISVYTAFNFFYGAGITINSLTLVGMALAIGMLLDNSVVVLENIYRLSATGGTPERSVTQGTREVWRSILAATLTTVTVFLPFVFSDNFLIKLMGHHIGVSIISTLLISLAVALLFIPMATYTVLRRAPLSPRLTRSRKKAGSLNGFRKWFESMRPHGGRGDKDTVFYEKVSVTQRPVQIYLVLLKTCMRNPGVTIFGAVILLFFCLVLSISLNIQERKEVESDRFSIYVTMPTGSTLENADQVVHVIEERLAGFPEKQDLISRIRETDAELTLVLKEDYRQIGKRSIADIKSDVQTRLRAINGAEISLSEAGGGGSRGGSGSGDMMGGVGSFMRLLGIGENRERIVIKGSDFDLMQRVAEDFRYYLDEQEFIRNTRVSYSRRQPEIRLGFDPILLTSYDISRQNIASGLTSLNPEISSGTSFKVGEDTYDIIIRNRTSRTEEEEEAGKNRDRTVDDLREVRIPSASGGLHRLEDIASVNYGRGRARITRVNQDKQIELFYSFSRDVEESKDLLEGYRSDIDQLVSSYNLPSGVAVEVFHEEDMFADFKFLLLAAFILIFMILASVFESLTTPFVLLFSIPLAAIGSLLALLLTGNSLLNNANVMIGFLILLGVVVNNGIILIDYANILRQRGYRRNRALMTAGLRRSWFRLVKSIPLIGKRRRPFKALRGVSFEIRTGMFGLLGPNGAGKSTLMRIICGILEQSYGSIWINGLDTRIYREELQSLIGFLPQEFGTYENMSSWEFLDYQAILKGLVDPGLRRERLEYVLRAVHMFDRKDEKIGSFSGGMKQRIGIALILLHLPRILVVDEPTAGLDPRERIRFRNLLVELSKDRIVIFSTHIIEDISSSCSQVAVINKGSLKYFGDPVDMVGMAAGKVWQFDIDKTEFEQALDKSRIVNHIQKDDRIRVRYLSVTSPHDEAVQVEPNLEDAYLCLLKGI